LWGAFSWWGTAQRLAAWWCLDQWPMPSTLGGRHRPPLRSARFGRCAPAPRRSRPRPTDRAPPTAPRRPSPADRAPPTAPRRPGPADRAPPTPPLPTSLRELTSRPGEPRAEGWSKLRVTRDFGRYPQLCPLSGAAQSARICVCAGHRFAGDAVPEGRLVTTAGNAGFWSLPAVVTTRSRGSSLTMFGALHGSACDHSRGRGSICPDSCLRRWCGCLLCGG
jgi:hypothetical protein